MVNVTQYISKSRIAELIADLTQVPIAATNYNYETGSLSGFCIDLSSQTLSNRFIAISGGSDGYRCNDGSYTTCGQNYCSSDQWALETVGPDKTKYCVDSSGFKGPSNGDIYHCRATVCSCTRRE